MPNKTNIINPRELSSVGSDIAYYMQLRTLHFSTIKLCEL